MGNIYGTNYVNKARGTNQAENHLSAEIKIA